MDPLAVIYEERVYFTLCDARQSHGALKNEIIFEIIAKFGVSNGK